jgi:hypothetical protein
MQCLLAMRPPTKEDEAIYQLWIDMSNTPWVVYMEDYGEWVRK